MEPKPENKIYLNFILFSWPPIFFWQEKRLLPIFHKKTFVAVPEEKSKVWLEKRSYFKSIVRQRWRFLKNAYIKGQGVHKYPVTLPSICVIEVYL